MPGILLKIIGELCFWTDIKNKWPAQTRFAKKSWLVSHRFILFPTIYLTSGYGYDQTRRILASGARGYLAKVTRLREQGGGDSTEQPRRVARGEPGRNSLARQPGTRIARWSSLLLVWGAVKTRRIFYPVAEKWNANPGLKIVWCPRNLLLIQWFLYCFVWQQSWWFLTVILMVPEACLGASMLFHVYQSSYSPNQHFVQLF